MDVSNASTERAMWVESIRVKNFRSIRDATLEFESSGLTVLVGKNGSGKTSFVEAIGLPSSIARDGLVEAVTQRWGITSLLPAGSPDSLDIELCLRVDGRDATYDLGLASKDGAPVVASERMAFSDDSGSGSDRADRPRLAPTAVLLSEPDSGFERIAEAVARVLVHWSNTSALVTPKSPDYTLPLSQCSWNWSSIAERLLSNGGREALLEVTAAISGVTDVRIRTVGNYLVPEVQQVGLPPDVWLGMNQVSAGTLGVLDLLVATHQPYEIVLLALEEPESGVHATMADLIVELLREVSLRYQVVFTTHSPSILRQVRPAEIRVIERGDSGSTASRLLPRQVELVESGDFSLDELLAIEGLRAEV